MVALLLPDVTSGTILSLARALISSRCAGYRQRGFGSEGIKLASHYGEFPFLIPAVGHVKVTFRVHAPVRCTILRETKVLHLYANAPVFV